MEQISEKNMRIVVIAIVVIALSVGFLGVRANGGVLGDNEVGGTTGLSITLHYTDGESKTYDPEENLLTRLGVIPLYVADPSTGKEISKITYEVKLKASWEGELVDYSLSGSDVEVSIRNAETVDNPSISTPSLKNGEYVTISSGSVRGSKIDSVAFGYWSRDTEVFIDIEADIQLSADFADGSTDSKTARTTGSVKVLWEPDAPPSTSGALSSLRVTIDRDRLT